MLNSQKLRDRVLNCNLHIPTIEYLWLLEINRLILKYGSIIDHMQHFPILELENAMN